MPNNPNLISEEQVPGNWVPVESNTIVPGQAPKSAPAPPVPNDMPPYFQGSLAPQLQHDTSFVGTEVASPRIPKYSLMPFGQQTSAFTNAASQSTTTISISGAKVSVTLILPGIFTPASQTVNLPGTVTVALAAQSANQFFAGPYTGASASPGFRNIFVNDLASGVGTSTQALFSSGTTGTQALWKDVWYQTVQSSAVSETQRHKLNFTTGVTVTDNPGNDSTDISVAPAGPATSININGVAVSVNRLTYTNGVQVASTTWSWTINGVPVTG